MKSIASCSFLLGVLFGAPAGAQDAILDDARLGPVRGALTTDVQAARSEGLPAEWLLDKINEGLSKHVAAPRIASAVHVLLTRIRTADRLLSSIPRGDRPLRPSVDALTAGAPEAELARLIRTVLDREHDPGAVRAALVTVAELAEREFDGIAATQATLDAYRRGGQRGMNALLRDARQIQRSQERDDALRRLGRGVDRGHQGRDHAVGGEPGRGSGR